MDKVILVKMRIIVIAERFLIKNCQFVKPFYIG